MSKRPIWLDDMEMEIVRGYLAELLDNNQTPKINIEALESAYRQTLDTEEN
jgi:hypothetical protein